MTIKVCLFLGIAVRQSSTYLKKKGDIKICQFVVLSSRSSITIYATALDAGDPMEQFLLSFFFVKCQITVINYKIYCFSKGVKRNFCVFLYDSFQQLFLPSAIYLENQIKCNKEFRMKPKCFSTK